MKLELIVDYGSALHLSFCAGGVGLRERRVDGGREPGGAAESALADVVGAPAARGLKRYDGGS